MFETVLILMLLLVVPELIYLKVRAKRTKDILNMDNRPTPSLVNNPGTHIFKCTMEDWNKNLETWANIKNASNTSNLQ